jgi:hypothetical protein
MVRADEAGFKGLQVCFVARGRLKAAGFHLGEAVLVEPAADGGFDPVAGQ